MKNTILFSVLSLLAFNAAAVSSKAVNDGTVGSPLTQFACNAAKKDGGNSCKLDLSISATTHRARDSRFLSIMKNGVSGSGLFPGKVHRVSNAVDFNKLGRVVRAGDQIQLVGSIWNNQTLRLGLNGAAQRPIIILPAAGSTVVFKGTSSLTLTGSNIVVYGLVFDGGVANKSYFTSLKLGFTTDPCDSCILMRSKVSNVDGGNFRHIYLYASGVDMTIAHNEFSGQTGDGTLVSFSSPTTSPKAPRLHFLRNHLRDRAPGEGNGHEGLYMSSPDHQGFSLVENNLFENLAGEQETIKVGFRDTIVRNNTFRNNVGTLSLRFADRVLMEGNFFDGSASDNMGGIRVFGRDHVIVNNYFKKLKALGGNKALYPISLGMGNYLRSQDIVSGYAQAISTMIMSNMFIGCEKGIYIGSNHDKKGVYNLPPVNTVAVNNYFSNTIGLAYEMEKMTANEKSDVLESLVILRNFHSKGTVSSGLAALSSRVEEFNDTRKVVALNGIYQLDYRSTAIDNKAIASLDSYLRTFDIHGNAISSYPEFGASEFVGSTGLVRKPATAASVFAVQY